MYIYTDVICCKGRPAARRRAVWRRSSHVCRNCPATTWSVCSVCVCSPRTASVPCATARSRFRRLFYGRRRASLPVRRMARGAQRARRWLPSIAGAIVSSLTSSANSPSTAHSLLVSLLVVYTFFGQYLRNHLGFIYCRVTTSIC